MPATHPASTDVVDTPQVPSPPDSLASQSIHPTIGQIPLHVPPVQPSQAIPVAQSVSQAGPIAPDSTPAPTGQLPSRRTNKTMVMTATIVFVCIFVAIALGVDHKL